MKRNTWDILRPAVLPFIGYGGLYLAISELRVSPVHHNTIIWVLGFGLAGYAIYGLYKEWDNRRRLRRWLRETDRQVLVDGLPTMRKVVRHLPSWDRNRYLAKKREHNL